MHPDESRNSEAGVTTSEYTKTKLLNQSIQLEFDVGERDQYGRLLAYIYTSDGLMYNAHLAAEGYANQMTYQPNVRWVSLFTALVANAMRSDRGLWAFDEVDGKTLLGTSGDVVIVKVDYYEEIATIKNNGSTEVNLTGWKLESVRGNQIYNFPDGFILGAGKTIYVTSGKNAKEGNGYLKWTTANVHNNDEDNPAVLYDMNGNKISEY